MSKNRNRIDMTEIDRKELLESDEFWSEIIDNLLFNHLMGQLSKRKFIKSILKYKNELIKTLKQ